MTVHPVESVEAWLETELPEGQRRAQQAARNCLRPGQGTTYLEVLQALDDTGRPCGALVYQLLPGDEPYLVFVERDPAMKGRGVGNALFLNLRARVTLRPIEALETGAEGVAAMRRWGFRKKSDGWWKFDDLEAGERE